MTDKALNERREYQRKYYKEHREHIRETHNKWRHDNKDKIKKYSISYWEKVAQRNLQTD